MNANTISLFKLLTSLSAGEYAWQDHHIVISFFFVSLKNKYYNMQCLLLITLGLIRCESKSEILITNKITCTSNLSSLRHSWICMTIPWRGLFSGVRLVSRARPTLIHPSEIRGNPRPSDLGYLQAFKAGSQPPSQDDHPDQGESCCSWEQWKGSLTFLFLFSQYVN